MGKLRAAIYARHSTDKQNPTSSRDQVDACRSLVTQLDAEAVETYADPEISGYRRDRPGLMRMLGDIEDGLIDIVVCEALDRIARDGEDISWLGKKLSYHRVKLFTHAEREIDEVKLAVAGLIGSMFLSNLRKKTFRGMRAAVLAGRLGGGSAYGYRKVARVGDDGKVVNGIVEIVLEQAEVVRRIFREFADGRSSIHIATGLNRVGVPGPRGGEWNASTIRGDPKKAVGILNNPLYRGKLVWGRREWRKNPDTDRRERRYRVREESEWITVDLPELRIVDADLAERVDQELGARRKAGATTKNSVAARRARHLLFGLIRCGACGSNYTIVGKDYYRCARNRERGTCDNSASVRLQAVEEAALRALQSQLLTPDLVRLFTEEFTREVERLTRSRSEADDEARERLKVLDVEIENLAAHFLTASVSPTLTRMLADREAEKERLLRQIDARPAQSPKVVPHPMLVRRYELKVAKLREELNDDLVRQDAIVAIRSLIGAVTVHVGEDGAQEIEVEASVARLIEFSKNTEAPRPGVGGRSVTLVAGTRNTRCLRQSVNPYLGLIECHIPRFAA